MVVGMMLVKKAILTVVVIIKGVFWSFVDRRGRRIGVRRIISVSKREVLKSSVVSTTFTWSCTKMGGS